MSDQNVEVLLVEDSPEDAELVIRTLKKHNLANKLFHVDDGAEALEFLFAQGKYADSPEVQNPRVVFLDLKLPKLNGLEVLRAIRSDPRTKHIPVVMLTSSKEDRDLATAYDYGANSYVVKPVDFEKFSRAIKTIGMYWMVLNQNPNA